MIFEIALFTVLAIVKRCCDYSKENERLAQSIENDTRRCESDLQEKQRQLQFLSGKARKEEECKLAEEKLRILKSSADEWFGRYKLRLKDLKKVKRNLAYIQQERIRLGRARVFFFLKRIFFLTKLTWKELIDQICILDDLLIVERRRKKACYIAISKTKRTLDTVNEKVKGMRTHRSNLKRSLKNESKKNWHTSQDKYV